MIHNDYETDYESLLEMNGKPAMEIKGKEESAIEIFITANNLL